MSNNETLDRRTAGFIAAIANALGRKISQERMKQLIGNPEKLRIALLPMIDDAYAELVPDILRVHARGHGEPHGSEQGFTSFRMDHFPPGHPPTMRRIMDEARKRKCAILTRAHARHLVNLFYDATLELENRGVAVFPYMCDKKLCMFWCAAGNLGEEPVDLDEADKSFIGCSAYFAKDSIEGTYWPQFD